MAAAVPPGWEDTLDPGERILWQGKPRAALRWQELLDTRTIFGLGFALFALAFIAGTLVDLVETPAPDVMDMVFPLFGLPFLAIGLNTVFGRVFGAWWRLKGTSYTLTDRHAFIATEARGRRRLQRYPLGPKLFPALEEGDPGSVWFAAEQLQSPGSRLFTRFIAQGPAGRVGFEEIDEARKVHRLMLEAQGALQTEMARSQPPPPPPPA